MSIASLPLRHPRAADPPLPRVDPVLSPFSGTVEAITRWLRSQGVAVEGQPRVQRCDGGMSHLTYRLRYDSHDLVLRRPLQDHGGLQRMRREFGLQRALGGQYPVAEMVRLCADPAVAGAPFYVMRHVPGIVPRRRSFAGIALSADDARRLCVNVLDAMIALHRIELGSLASKTPDFAPSHGGHLRKLLLHWLGRHARIRTRGAFDPRPIGQWLIEHIPARRHEVLLHNDWRLDNMVFDPEQPDRIRAVLDWEFAAVGDPLMDLGIMLSYWIDPGDNFLMRRYQWQPSHLPGMLSRDELLDRYLRASGRDPADWAFYQIFGLFRYLLTLQELHLRHVLQAGARRPREDRAGDQTDFFKGIWVLIHYVGWKCRRLMRHA